MCVMTILFSLRKEKIVEFGTVGITFAQKIEGTGTIGIGITFAQKYLGAGLG